MDFYAVKYWGNERGMIYKLGRGIDEKLIWYAFFEHPQRKRDYLNLGRVEERRWQIVIEFETSHLSLPLIRF